MRIGKFSSWSDVGDFLLVEVYENIYIKEGICNGCKKIR